MPEAKQGWSPRRVAAATLVVVGVAAGFGLLYLFRHALFLLFIAIVLATAVKPLVVRLQRQGYSRTVAVAGVYAIVAMVLAIAAIVVVPLLIDQVTDLAAKGPEIYRGLRERLDAVPSKFLQRIMAFLPGDVSAPGQQEAVVGEAVRTVERTLRYAGYGLGGIFAGIVIVLLAFYWSLQEDRTLRWLFLVAPPDSRDWFKGLFAAAESKVGAYVLGQGLLCLMVGLMCLVAYLALGLPYAVLLALIAAIFEAIPFLGPILFMIPPILVAFTIDPSKVLWVIGVNVAIQQIENYLLVPRVMDRSVGVHPMGTLLALAAFTAVWGIPGAIMAIPMAAIIQVVVERTLLVEEKVPEPQGRDVISVLRYQAQELVQDVRLQIRSKSDEAIAGSDLLENTVEAIAHDLDEGLAKAAQQAAAEVPAVENGEDRGP